jgi:FkbM family methyltransferase
MILLKKIAAKLPIRWQNELKKFYFSRQIIKNTFEPSEPEYDILPNFIKPGDWVVDIGANVGHYTKRFSELVGAQGRVIAFEPVPTTFAILAANVQLFHNPNVTLINAAVSDKLDVLGMSIPKFSTGLNNYYQAHLSATSPCELSVLTVSLDFVCINHRIALIKIDAEGHESFVLSGMRGLLKKYHPVLIVETDSNEVISDLLSLGYISSKLENSPNILFVPESYRSLPSS